MKTDVVDVSETRKHLLVEIPSAVVDQAIERLTRQYGRVARVPGFRPGKVPPRVVRQRYKDQILHDVAHELIPPAVNDALRERGLDPVETPQIRDVTVEEGRPLSFTADFETLPPIDPGDYATLRVSRPPVAIEASAVDEALERLRRRAARLESIDDRPSGPDDTVVVDLERRPVGTQASAPGSEPAKPEEAKDVMVDIGSSANPPGFDEHLIGVSPGDTRAFTVNYPADYRIQDLAGTAVDYSVMVKGVRRRVLPELDDEFAKDLGEFDSLGALRARVSDDLQHEAEQAAERDARADLLQQIARRVTGDVPASLIEREMDRRLEELARRLMEQRIDPRKAEIDWADVRERQRESAEEGVRSTLVLDEVARREHIVVTEADLDEEVTRFAERLGQTPAAVRAKMEKEGGLARLAVGMRREKTMEFLLSRASIEVA